jgi:site-specific recombinase XerD
MRRAGPVRAARRPAMHSARDRRHGNDPGDGRVIPEASDAASLRLGPTGALVTAWEQSLARRRLAEKIAPATYRQYTTMIRVWLTWLHAHDLVQPTTADVERFLAWGVDQGWGVHTVAAHRLALRSLYGWAARQHDGPDITDGVAALTTPQPAPAPLLRSPQVQRLIAAIAGRDLRAHRDRFILALLYGSALESVSLHRATRGDYNARTGRLRHQPRGARSANAIVQLGSRARQLADRYLAAVGRQAPRDPLFAALHCTTGASMGRPLSTHSMRLLVRRCLDVVYAHDPAVTATPESRRSSRRQQRPASRALRRSGLAALVSRVGVKQAMATGRGDSNALRFRQSVAQLIPVRESRRGGSVASRPRAAANRSPAR